MHDHLRTPRPTSLSLAVALASSLIGAAASAAPKAKTLWPPIIKHLHVRQPGQPPPLAISNNSIIVALGFGDFTGTGEVRFFNYDPDWKEAQEILIPGYPASSAMTMHPRTGQIVNCTSAGWGLHYLNIHNPLTSFFVPLSPERDIQCLGLAFDGDSQRLWLGVRGSQSVALVNPSTMQVLRRIEGVSGSYYIRNVGRHLFTSSITTSSQGRAVPLVLNIDSERAVVGAKLGDTSRTRLKSEYSTHIFDDSASSGLVYYLNHLTHELVGFDAFNPSEDKAIRFATDNPQPRQVLRHHQCLVVMGRNYDDDWLYPRWTVIRNDSPGSYQILGTTPYLEDKSVNAPSEMAIDPKGNIYLSHHKGLSRVEGLLDSYDCK